MPRGDAKPSNQVLASKYSLADQIGRGASGIVYKALNIQTGGMVAVKKVALRDQSKDHLQLLQRDRVLSLPLLQLPLFGCNSRTECRNFDHMRLRHRRQRCLLRLIGRLHLRGRLLLLRCRRRRVF